MSNDESVIGNISVPIIDGDVFMGKYDLHSKGIKTIH